ncbi:MAG TPA: DHA2 family efflux MFS transporter permease subunit [Bradyrhizobium sp.]|nr:DHA2 family efflux MFS transporter permease subunit [Bradyrhizobium sp.]
MSGVDSTQSGPGADQSRSAAGKHNPWLIAVVISIATFMEVLDSSIANVALSHIAGALGANADESTWVLTSYLVASAVILPASAWLSGVLGRKRFYLLCVTLFSVSSFLCGIAPNLESLIVFRVLQGLGGGGMAPSEQSMLADTFPPEKRAQAFALYGIAVIVAPTIGPALGGYITDTWSWNWIFFINVPIGALALFLVSWLVSEPEVLKRERRERLKGGLRFDVVGFVLVALWLGCLEIVLDKGQENNWFASDTIRTFAAISFVSMLILLPWEYLRNDPIFDVRLIFQRQFGGCFLAMLGVGAILYGSTQVMPALVQSSFGYTATLAGLMLLPGGLAMALLMPLSGQITKYVQPKFVIAAALLILSTALWHATNLAPEASFHYFVWSRVYQMVAMPFLFIPIMSASYVGIPSHKSEQAASLINVARNTGGSMGISLYTTVLARHQQFHQSRLVESIFPSSIEYQNRLSQLTEYFVQRGSSKLDAHQQAIAFIGRQVSEQAQLLSYIDVFATLGTLALVLMAIVLILLRTEPERRSTA